MHTQSFTNPQFLKIGLTHKKSPVESPTVATCPFAGMQSEAHRCAFQRRKDARSRHQRLFVENVRKNRTKPVKMKILSSGVVFTFEEGISTSHVCLEGQQPLIECANMTLIFMFPFMFLYPLYPFYIFSFLWSTRVFPFTPTYSSICDEEIRPT